MSDDKESEKSSTFVQGYYTTKLDSGDTITVVYNGHVVYTANGIEHDIEYTYYKNNPPNEIIFLPEPGQGGGGGGGNADPTLDENVQEGIKHVKEAVGTWKATAQESDARIKIIQDEVLPLFEQMINNQAQVWGMYSLITAINKRIDYIKYKIAAIELKLFEISRDTIPIYKSNIWCADLSEHLTGNVETIEIDAAPNHIIIGPGGYTLLRGKNNDAGMLADPMTVPYTSAVLAWTLQPGFQKWRPTYRIATITSIDYDNDKCDVTLDPKESSIWNKIGGRVDINIEPILKDIPIQYMSCDSEAFVEDDRVVVEFRDMYWTNQSTNVVVIGFETEPRPCPAGFLVEMGGDYFGGPEAFAEFVVSRGLENGYGPGVAGPANLVFARWVYASEPLSQDPLGIVGQVTYRQKWYPSQNKRIDQGYLAYPTDNPQQEEVTRLASYNDLWTYEDIPIVVNYLEVDPGPPPPEICNYHWVIPSEYGGSGGEVPEGEDNYFPNRDHLAFYKVAGKTIYYWWPEEFNQLIHIQEKHWIEGAFFKYVDLWDSGWESVEEQGINGAVGSLIFPGSFSKRSRVINDRHRQFFILWGYFGFGHAKDYSGAEGFPYKTYTPMRYETTTNESSVKIYRGDGVYLFEDNNKYIQGFVELDGEITTDYMRSTKRWHGSEAYFDIDTSKLTANQATLYEGNADLGIPWQKDPFTQVEVWEETKKSEYRYTVGVLCEGREYTLGGGNDLGKIDFNDYGIFTVANAGIDEFNLINIGEVVPAYAFSVEIDDEIVYGYIAGGKLYHTERFGKIDARQYNVPGTESCPWKCSERVRLALQEIYEEPEPEPEDEEEPEGEPEG